VLLGRGHTDINLEGGEYGSALQAAAYNGHVGIVERLLNNGAKVNATGGEFGSALQAAAYRGHIDVVNKLLERRANVNMEGGKYGSALQAASEKGHTVIVNLLLEKGPTLISRPVDMGAPFNWPLPQITLESSNCYLTRAPMSTCKAGRTVRHYRLQRVSSGQARKESKYGFFKDFWMRVLMSTRGEAEKTAP